MFKYKDKTGKVVEAVKYKLCEFSDYPYHFDNSMYIWLTENIKNEMIKPVFKTEDYWYLEVETVEGKKIVAPDDYIIRDENGDLYVRESKQFKEEYSEIKI